MSEAAVFNSSPGPITSASPSGSLSTEETSSNHNASVVDPSRPTAPVINHDTQQSNPEFPSTKPEKPRPHICGTCGRSFARLEHLKRHERSHTKEKPFECPECQRCFARRDLLLRHQQKLHMITTPASKPRGGRRESASGLGPSNSGRVRKNSMSVGGPAGVGNSSMRPRANTISHVDGQTVGMLSGTNANVSTSAGMHHSSLAAGSGGFSARPLASAPSNHHHTPVLPRLATHGLNINLNGSLRTAPPGPNMGSFNFDDLNGGGSTVNPAQLHLSDSVQPSPSSPFAAHFGAFPSQQPPPIMEDPSAIDWVQGFHNQMTLENASIQNLRHSPASMDGASPSTMHESQFENVNSTSGPNTQNWPVGLMPPASTGLTDFGMNSMANGANVGDFLSYDLMSQEDFRTHTNGTDQMFITTQSMNSLSPGSGLSGGQHQFPQPMNFGSEAASMSSPQSMNGSGRASSITSVSTDSITDATRQALLVTLSQPSAFSHHQRKHSQPTVSSPLSSRDQNRQSSTGVSLPSTQDLRRFVTAYIQYFHPHFPFLHIPTLSFDTPGYTTDLRTVNGSAGYAQGGILGGDGGIILSMAAIGALYEFDRQASRELFDDAKKVIQIYLAERRKADGMNLKQNSDHNQHSTGELAAQNTPLWLVQAMLLNVIYGHNCGDKVAGDIASTHCTALITLAKAAELLRPMSEVQLSNRTQFPSHEAMNGDVNMTDDFEANGTFQSGISSGDENSKWSKWIVSEERKRTLFAIFHMSSLLVSAYNHPPALVNSEIELDLPCDEELWAAPNASTWAAKGGSLIAEQNALPFSTALSGLLSASEYQNPMTQNQSFGSGVPITEVPQSPLRPSTFGCLVLIDALHNYIWETRQHHMGRRWTTHQTEVMQAHIEPALRAWQAAWASNPAHSLERPNPYGLGPLSADSIPLLDLAYVRLFVNLGTSKEAFWQRDFDAMAEELARGMEIIQHADHSDSTSGAPNSLEGSRNSPEPSSGETKLPLNPADQMQSMSVTQRSSTKRERHLRKAAFYAADSLSMSDRLGVTFAHFTSRELPVQSAMCAFDCAQVLAEWTATVQERVGRFLGVLGRDSIDYTQMPAMALLEDEDCKLLEKISDILQNADDKMMAEINAMNCPPAVHVKLTESLPSAIEEGFGSKILRVTAFMLNRAAVWPVTNVMSQGLQIQANHMCNRTDASITAGR